MHNESITLPRLAIATMEIPLEAKAAHRDRYTAGDIIGDVVEVIRPFVTVHAYHFHGMKMSFALSTVRLAYPVSQSWYAHQPDELKSEVDGVPHYLYAMPDTGLLVPLPVIFSAYPGQGAFERQTDQAE